MRLRTSLLDLARPILRKHVRLKRVLAEVETRADMLRHSAANWLPQLIRPDPRSIYITLTANCNLRCIGCRYGRDFMPGKTLPWATVRDLLDDVKEIGFESVRLYGGEPLLHKDLVRIVEHGVGQGLNMWMTTNGILLRERIDALYDAGLRHVSLGFYGTGDDYNTYVQRKDQYVKLEAGVAYVRERYGEKVDLSLGWVLMRPTCTVEALHEVWRFATRYDMLLGVNLIHYSLPYFTEGPDRMLQFKLEDRSQIEKVVAELIRLKELRPDLIFQSPMSLRSITDWLLKGLAMRVPCERYRLIWVGADGTVQLCYVTFGLGNLHEKRLREMMFTPQHRQAARDAFALNCPNCHCSYDARIERHAPSRRLYSH